jgi:hypothetical protein
MSTLPNLAQAQQDLAVATAWLALGQQVFAGGTALWSKIKATLVDNGYNGDTSVLDGLIADSDRRKAQAESDAVPPIVPGT